MAAKFSMESKRLWALLEDGEWADLEPIRAKLAAGVAPGRALRCYEQRAANWQKRTGPRQGPELSDEEKIGSGQRTLARAAINSMKSRYVQVVETESGPKIRRRPGAELAVTIKKPGEEEITADGDPEPVEAVIAADAITGSTEDLQGGPRVGPLVLDHGLPVALTTCPTCWLLVANQEQHEEWHRMHPSARQEPPQPAVDTSEEAAPVAVAFFAEDEVRAIVRDEMAAVLDTFQKGMQGFLINRFAALETLIRPEAFGAREWKPRGARRDSWS